MADVGFSVYITLYYPVSRWKFATFHESIWTQSNSLFLRPTLFTAPNNILIKSAIFPEFTLINYGQNDDGTQAVRTGCLCFSAVHLKNTQLLVINSDRNMANLLFAFYLAVTW